MYSSTISSMWLLSVQEEMHKTSVDMATMENFFFTIFIFFMGSLFILRGISRAKLGSEYFSSKFLKDYFFELVAFIKCSFTLYFNKLHFLQQGFEGQNATACNTGADGFHYFLLIFCE